jgi:hypothetical protein
MAGRPRIYDSPDELESQCEAYFRQCADDEERPTVTGLALSLGFASKQSLYDYEKDERFSYPIKKSLLRVENGLEQRLTSPSVAGVIFALKNMGWKDESTVDTNMNVIWPETRTYPDESNRKTN